MEQLNDYIPVLQEKYLDVMLGVKLKKQFLEGLEESVILDKWLRLRDGYVYDVSDISYEWKGFVRVDKISPIANYVFCNLITNNQFRNEGIGETRSKAENSVIITPQYRVSQAWNDMVLEYSPERIKILKFLSDKYRLFLLSNTNEIHIQTFESQFQEQFYPETFVSLFEAVYYSCRIGCRKPDTEAFFIVLNAHQLTPESTLLVDDSIHNIESAKEMGMQTWLFQDSFDPLISLLVES